MDKSDVTLERIRTFVRVSERGSLSQWRESSASANPP